MGEMIDLTAQLGHLPEMGPECDHAGPPMADADSVVSLVAQRDEALAALRELEAVTSHYPQCPSRTACVCGLAKAKDAARTILAKYPPQTGNGV